jgi:hypothetical protein
LQNCQPDTSSVVTGALDRPIEVPLSWTTDSRNVMLTVIDDRIKHLASVQVSGGHVERATNAREVIARPSS